MSISRQLLTDVRRGSVWQITGAYVIGAWFALQAAETVSSLVGLPLWFGRAFLVVLLLGLPVIAFTAAVQGRRRGTAEEDGEETVTADPAEGSSAEAPTEQPAPTGGAGRRLFTWRNALLGGVGALVLLGVGAAGHMTMRSLGIGPAGTLVAKGLLAERSRIILATSRTRRTTPGRRGWPHHPPASLVELFGNEGKGGEG